MSASFLAEVRKAVDQDVNKCLAEIIDEHPQKTQDAVTSSVPALVSAMLRRSITPDGAEQVFRAVSEFDGGMVSNFRMIVESGQYQDLADVGNRLARCVFGAETDRISEAIANHAFIAPEASKTLLKIMTPLVLAIAGEQRRMHGLNRNSVTTLLEAQRSFFTLELPADELERLSLENSSESDESDVDISISMFVPPIEEDAYVPPIKVDEPAESCSATVVLSDEADQQSFDVVSDMTTDKSVSEELVSEELVSEESVSEESVSEESVSEELVSEELVSEELVSEELVSEELVSEELVSEELVSEELVSGESVSGESVSGESVSGESVSEELVSEESVSDESVSGESVSGESVSEESVSEELVSEELVSEELVSEELVSEELVSEELVSGESVSEESVSEELVSEELVSEELVSEELVSEELVSEELVSEELVSEESVSEESVSEIAMSASAADANAGDGSSFADELLEDYTFSSEDAKIAPVDLVFKAILPVVAVSAVWFYAFTMFGRQSVVTIPATTPISHQSVVTIDLSDVDEIMGDESMPFSEDDSQLVLIPVTVLDDPEHFTNANLVVDEAAPLDVEPAGRDDDPFSHAQELAETIGEEAPMEAVTTESTLVSNSTPQNAVLPISDSNEPQDYFLVGDIKVPVFEAPRKTGRSYYTTTSSH